MIHTHRRILLALIVLPYWLSAYKAVVISPIVDLVGAPLTPLQFKSLPLCGGSQEPFIACKRGHQLLCNEIVEIVDQTNDLVCVSVPHIFYVAQNSDKKYNRYWAEKKHFMRLDDSVDDTKVPASVSAVKPHDTDTITTLIMPYYHPTHHRTYSSGTRFVRVHPRKREKNIAVWAFCPTKKRFERTTIPASCCYIPKSHDPQHKIADFVQIVRQWAHLKKGYIPYVWGGCSYTEPALSSHFYEKVIKEGKKHVSFYCIDGYTLYPMSGFDCSSLVLRAAQICTIPYYFKNTTTLSRFLSELKPSDTIENGDLIWIPWHVMIISDCDKNLLVEARSYNHGYGKVHELPLHKVFKDVYSYKDLLHRLRTKAPIERINKQGVVMDTFPTFKILKLKSAFTESSGQ